jgi:hypothetical protein
MSAWVLFFGGYKATRTDVNVWCASAKAQKPDITFDGYPWPSGAKSDAVSAVSTFKQAGSYAQALGIIRECATDCVYLVGHSSGCAIANAVDRGLKDTSNVILVALDGFLPSRAQLARPSTQVWAAVCGKARSRNHDALKNAIGGRLKVYQATDCFDSWSLHFSVVNSAANDRAVTSIASGYAQCRANLRWMP